MSNEHRHPRILFLDGLRCIAISLVILFHYFSRWTTPHNFENLYPYGNLFAPLFEYGFYGMQLFFIVSGFVITLTLYRCSSFIEFGVRRFARLWPSMALRSVITLLLIRIIPNHFFHVSPLGLLPSLTFIEPSLWNATFHTKAFHWIDDSYWSLFVEVRFYLLSALLFFYRRDSFPRNIYLFSRIVLALSLLAALLHLTTFDRMFNLFFITWHLPWFLIGVAFYLLGKNIEERLRARLIAVGILSLLARALLNRSYSEAGAAVILPLFFLAASRTSFANRILSQRWLTGVGAASYSLYLLHQSLGTAFIGWLGCSLGFTGYYSATLAILTSLIAVMIAKLIYTYWESPLNRVIVAVLRVK